MMEQVQCGEIPDQRDYELATTVLACISPEGSDAMRYCVEVITIIALQLRSQEGRELFLEYLSILIPASNPVSTPDLMLLSGFALGLLVSEQSDHREMNCEVIEHIQEYQKLVAGMNAHQRRELADSLQDVSVLLTESQTAQSLAKPMSEAVGQVESL
jgi:hypothetical protein